MTDLEWHPDPSGRHELRHWDGHRWTAYVMDHGIPAEDHHGASPPPPPTSVPPGTGAPSSTLGTAVKWGFGLAAGWTMFLLVAVVLFVGGCGALLDSSG